MIFIEIRCDKCQTVGISRHCFYAHQLRQELKGQGWKCIEAGGKDYCPKCKPRRKPVKAKVVKLANVVLPVRDGSGTTPNVVLPPLGGNHLEPGSERGER